MIVDTGVSVAWTGKRGFPPPPPADLATGSSGNRGPSRFP